MVVATVAFFVIAWAAPLICVSFIVTGVIMGAEYGLPARFRRRA
jgi:hypothetical protein